MIDIGLNISSDKFNKDRKEVLLRALNNKVKGFIFTGTSYESTKISALVSEEYPLVSRFTSGVHPHNAKNWSKEADGIIRLASHPNCVAVGECGLDYDRMFSPKEIQKEVLKEHLELALNLNKPVFLHIRGVDGDINSEKEILNDFKEIYLPYKELGLKGVVHCFTMGGRSLESLKALDLYFGITGWVCDERRGKALQSIIQYIPNNRLMIETDAPYLIPRARINKKDKKNRPRNEPAYLIDVLEKVSELKFKTLEEIEKITNNNVRELFGWDFNN